MFINAIEPPNPSPSLFTWGFDALWTTNVPLKVAVTPLKSELIVPVLGNLKLPVDIDSANIEGDWVNDTWLFEKSILDSISESVCEVNDEPNKVGAVPNSTGVNWADEFRVTIWSEPFKNCTLGEVPPSIIRVEPLPSNWSPWIVNPPIVPPLAFIAPSISAFFAIILPAGDTENTGVISEPLICVIVTCSNNDDDICTLPDWLILKLDELIVKNAVSSEPLCWNLINWLLPPTLKKNLFWFGSETQALFTTWLTSPLPDVVSKNPPTSSPSNCQFDDWPESSCIALVAPAFIYPISWLSAILNPPILPVLAVRSPCICNSLPVHLREFSLEPDSINSPLLLIRAAVIPSDTNPSFSLLINKPLPDVGIEEVLIISPVDGFTTLFSDALTISPLLVAAEADANSWGLPNPSIALFPILTTPACTFNKSPASATPEAETFTAVSKILDWLPFVNGTLCSTLIGMKLLLIS